MSSPSPSSPTEYLTSLDVSLRPKLLVLDIDYNIWPCHIEFECPPFELTRAAKFSKDKSRLVTTSQVTTGSGLELELFDGVEELLHALVAAGWTLAAASRTATPAYSRTVLKLMQIDTLFSYAEIYPSSKRRHFAQLAEDSGVAYDDMIFFDDDTRNVRDVSKLGVHVVYTPDGVTPQIIADSVREYVQRRAHEAQEEQEQEEAS